MGIDDDQANISKELARRKPIRLKGYDYSRAGLYFITICTQDRACLFGKIENEKMVLNDSGQMVNHWWNELNHKYRDIALHQQIVMPNHFHGIIQIKSPTLKPPTVGADLCVRPIDRCPSADLCVRPIDGPQPSKTGASAANGRTHRSAPTEVTQSLDEHARPNLPAIIQWFKTMTTNRYIRGVKNDHWTPFNKKLWQRNYYEHIIRNEESHHQISEYIQTNPARWQEDTYYKCKMFIPSGRQTLRE